MGCSDRTGSVCAPLAYTAQFPTLQQHRVNNQFDRTGNQILPTLRVSSNTQATLEQSPIQVLTELNVAWLQWSYSNLYFQADKPLNLPCMLYGIFGCAIATKWRLWFNILIDLPGNTLISLNKRMEFLGKKTTNWMLDTSELAYTNRQTGFRIEST